MLKATYYCDWLVMKLHNFKTLKNTKIIEFFDVCIPYLHQSFSRLSWETKTLCRKLPFPGKRYSQLGVIWNGDLQENNGNIKWYSLDTYFVLYIEVLQTKFFITKHNFVLNHSPWRSQTNWSHSSHIWNVFNNTSRLHDV